MRGNSLLYGRAQRLHWGQCWGFCTVDVCRLLLVGIETCGPRAPLPGLLGLDPGPRSRVKNSKSCRGRKLSSACQSSCYLTSVSGGHPCPTGSQEVDSLSLARTRQQILPRHPQLLPPPVPSEPLITSVLSSDILPVPLKLLAHGQ